MSNETKEKDRVMGAREALRPEEFFREQLVQRGVPAGAHDTVIGYLFYGWHPGHFLTAILTNDLKGAWQRGDDENLAALANYMAFFYHDVPSVAWGTPAKVEMWLEAVATVQDRISEAAAVEAEEICKRLTDRPKLGPYDSPTDVATKLVAGAGSTPQVNEIAIDWIAEALAEARDRERRELGITDADTREQFGTGH